MPTYPPTTAIPTAADGGPTVVPVAAETTMIPTTTVPATTGPTVVPVADAVRVTETTRYAKSKGQVFLLSACTDTQKAAETATQAGLPCGVLTKALLAALPTPGAMKLNRALGVLRAKIKQLGYIQTAQLSCGRAAAFDAALL